MAPITGRTRRRNTGGLHALIQGRVDNEIKSLADRGAAARGVSIPRYIEILVAADELAHAYVVSASEQEQQELDLQGEAV